MEVLEAILRARLEPRLQESRTAWDQIEAKRKAQETEWEKKRVALAARNNALPTLFTPYSLSHEPVLRPVRELEWKASFPSTERWQPARKDFCARLGLPESQVDAVMGLRPSLMSLLASDLTLFGRRCNPGVTPDWK